MNILNIRKCPFCVGGKKFTIPSGSQDNVLFLCVPEEGYQVRCEKCKATGPAAKTFEEAITLWNGDYGLQTNE